MKLPFCTETRRCQWSACHRPYAMLRPWRLVGLVTLPCATSIQLQVFQQSLAALDHRASLELLVVPCSDQQNYHKLRLVWVVRRCLGVSCCAAVGPSEAFANTNDAEYVWISFAQMASFGRFNHPLNTGEHKAREMVSHLADTEQTLPLSLRHLSLMPVADPNPETEIDTRRKRDMELGLQGC